MGNACCTKDEHSRGRGPSDRWMLKRRSPSERNMTVAVNMKNFKNLKHIEDIEALYTFGKELGKGSFGSVSRATRKGANFECAIKVINKDSLNSNPMLPKLMMSELTILRKCSHPNIMNVNEILEDNDNFYIVTELLEGGELFDRLIEAKSFSEPQTAAILKQVLLAINYMHQKNITHRDLKPENILLESADKDRLDIKISDFGFSCFFDPKEGLNLVLGSPLYMAPEIIGGQKYNEKVDIWSIGVISFMLLTGRNPFPGRNK